MIRGCVLLMRESFTFRTLEVKGDDMIADMASRYTRPSEMDLQEITIKEAGNLLAPHMKTTEVTKKANKIIQEQHDNFVNTTEQDEHIEDRITREVAAKNPECLVVEKEAEWNEKDFMKSIQEEL